MNEKQILEVLKLMNLHYFNNEADITLMEKSYLFCLPMATPSNIITTVRCSLIILFPELEEITDRFGTIFKIPMDE